MNAAEIGDLLGFAALYDNRKASDPDIMAWLKAIGDLPYADAEAAVAGHYGESTDRIMPGHIRTRVRAMRADRLAKTPVPSAGLAEVADHPGRYQRLVQASIRRIADGTRLPKAIGDGRPLEGDPPDEWQEAREAIEPAEIPPPDPRQVAAEQAAESRRLRGESEAS